MNSIILDIQILNIILPLILGNFIESIKNGVNLIIPTLMNDFKILS